MTCNKNDVTQSKKSQIPSADEEATGQSNSILNGLVDRGNTVNQELFHIPSCSAMLVPVRRHDGNYATLEWIRVIHHHNDGAVEILPPNHPLEVAEGITLPFYGRVPTPRDFKTWSVSAIEEFRNGNRPEPSEVFNKLCRLISKYVYFDQRHSPVQAIALWIIFTYVYPTWPYAPYLMISGTAGSGKSTLIDLLEQLVFRGHKSSSVTGPLLYRMLDAFGGTLLLDEAEELKDNVLSSMCLA
jgi:hypothetical protein